MVDNDIVEIDKFSSKLGELLTSYLDGHRSFAEVGGWMSSVISTDPRSRELIRQLYHILNHYEMDASLREQDASYASVTTSKLRAIATSLTSAIHENVEDSIDGFWK